MKSGDNLVQAQILGAMTPHAPVESHCSPVYALCLRLVRLVGFLTFLCFIPSPF